MNWVVVLISELFLLKKCKGISLIIYVNDFLKKKRRSPNHNKDVYCIYNSRAAQYVLKKNIHKTYNLQSFFLDFVAEESAS